MKNKWGSPSQLPVRLFFEEFIDLILFVIRRFLCGFVYFGYQGFGLWGQRSVQAVGSIFGLGRRHGPIRRHFNSHLVGCKSANVRYPGATVA